MRRKLRPPTYFSIPYGQEEAHAENLKLGLSVMPEGFVARICEICDGHGQRRQMYTHGCGSGYYHANGDCSYCERSGLLVGSKPAPVSVVYQVLNAAEALHESVSELSANQANAGHAREPERTVP